MTPQPTRVFILPLFQPPLNSIHLAFHLLAQSWLLILKQFISKEVVLVIPPQQQCPSEMALLTRLEMSRHHVCQSGIMVLARIIGKQEYKQAQYCGLCNRSLYK